MHYEDLPVGYACRVGSHVMQLDEMIERATRWDPQPFHIRSTLARPLHAHRPSAASSPRRCTCSRSARGCSSTIRIASPPSPLLQKMGLGKDKLRLPNPARPGDTLVYDTTCIATREPSRRNDVGIVTLADVLANQHGAPVLTQEVTLMVARRPAV